VTGIAIYMEGGGEGRDSRAALRLGMDGFLTTLKAAVREKSWRWKLVCCGRRDSAFDAFRSALHSRDYAIVVLLVDAEGPVKGSPCAHLKQRDKWDLTGASDEVVHLMVQTMEAWIIADTGALAAYYGRNFNASALPRNENLEEVAKAALATALEQATRHTQKGAYHKIRHASDLLKRIAPEKVRQRCPNCERMFFVLGQAIRRA
jgi:uncharacterized protein DUF4276